MSVPNYFAVIMYKNEPHYVIGKKTDERYETYFLLPPIEGCYGWEFFYTNDTFPVEGEFVCSKEGSRYYLEIPDSVFPKKLIWIHDLYLKSFIQILVKHYEKELLDQKKEFQKELELFQSTKEFIQQSEELAKSG